MGIIPKLHKNFHKLSVLDQQKEKERVRKETEALVDEMGQEDEQKALPAVRKYVEQIQQEQREEFYQDIQMLKKRSNDKQAYQRYLLFILQRYIKEEDIPKKYVLNAESTDEGIVIGIEGTEYVSAFKVCGIPEYDIPACKVLSTKTGNTVGRLEGRYNETESGIIIPEKGDLEIATREVDKKYGRSRQS